MDIVDRVDIADGVEDGGSNLQAGRLRYNVAHGVGQRDNAGVDGNRGRVG